MPTKELKVVENIEKQVRRELSCSAHSLDHSLRVFELCKLIAKSYPEVDLEVLELAALLHDIGTLREYKDASGKTDHAVEGAKIAAALLNEQEVPEKKIRHIQDCILSHRFKTVNKPSTLEAKILFDADKVDAVGAIGLARSFAWVGKNGANLYRKTDLDKYAEENLVGGTFEGRIKDKTRHSPQIEYETKIKNLKTKLYTDKAKEIFDERLKYFESFLNRLEKEVRGQL